MSFQRFVISSLENKVFVVDTEPYCIWGVDIKEQNIEFLKSIDVEYFDYVLKQHLASDDEKRASVAIQLAYHHALETLFSYIGAYLQAPDCSYAWIAKVQNIQLRSIVDKISNNDRDMFTRLNIPSLSWNSISELVFREFQPGTQKQKDTIDSFADLWRSLAKEFTDKDHAAQYNSMKHGFRVHSGGFSLSIGIEHEQGIAPPENEMSTLRGSKFGLSFHALEKVGSRPGDRSFISKQHSFNWVGEKTITLLQLISLSINNIIVALKIANGEASNTLQFLRPINSDVFKEAWRYVPEINNLTQGIHVNEREILHTTKQSLNDFLTQKKQNNDET